jgi:hypothetical protein
MSADLNAIKARHERIAASPAVADQQTEDIATLLVEVERLRAAINEYDPATALHEILDIDPTDPVNARAHRKAHERQMGEWHDRVVGRDETFKEIRDALNSHDMRYEYRNAERDAVANIRAALERRFGADWLTPEQAESPCDDCDCQTGCEGAPC